MSSSQPSRRTTGKPQLRAVVGGLDLEVFEDGRQAAALATVAGYEAALAALHPDDVTARHWYRARLNDARTIANLPPLSGGPLWALEEDDERTESVGPLGLRDRVEVAP